MSTWAEDEVQTADLEDRRLNNRLALLLERLGEHPQISIPAACGGWKETMGAYRFFDNGKATFEKILEPHRKQANKPSLRYDFLIVTANTPPMSGRLFKLAEAYG